ncbi:MAG TPA: SURF1 family protein [Gemmatimonadaceae bacterium]|nr:SURF1 family protein [Gemmatimonadaceae bacterium]
MRTRIVFFTLFSLAVSLGCIRLGFWQLERLRARRAQNAQVLARLAEAPVPLEHLPRNSTVRFRRVTTTGTYDFANEFVVTTRTRNGAPGVHIITPLRRTGTDTAFLVNRGWAYTPDGMTVDLNVFREDSAGIIDGFVEDFSIASGAVSTPSVERAVRRLDRDSISARLPYPLAAVVLIQQKDSGEFTAVDRGTPVRVQPPRLDEGSHRSYAIQWFGFAVVGIAGSLVVLQRDRKRRPGSGHQSALLR